ncbi:MAG TPA: chromosome segregation protein SMC [Thermoanaerobaculia bacterium]|nr:chromosome segregation protein SMC [Thermoanaerobaculia bacterium]
MLHLERIEISGFKSFAETIKLAFPPGITGVVGPNGCGKSNLSDAITWVLGEQSAKTLRGDKMEDVIFNGSERRKPVGMAEVAMTLRTDSPLEAAENGRIQIARRVFRDGESHYRINGRNVRLKDVRDLLMDTGLGIRAYSVIEQGKIGMILSGKPQERRRLLEEAAGITKYKTRKRIAEVKLEEATANLLRLADIVAEVERSLRSLKRQAAAAERYKEKEVEYRELLAQVLSGRWGRLTDEQAAIASDLAVATDREAELVTGVSREEAALAAARETLECASRELGEKHERYASLGARIEGRQELAKARRASLAEVRERALAGRELAAERERQIAGFASTLETLSRRRDELSFELAAAEAQVGAGAERLADAEKQLRRSSIEVEERRRELLTLSTEATGVANRLQQEQLEGERRRFQLGHLDEELAKADFELSQAGDQVTVARDLAETLTRRIAEKEVEIDTVETQLGQLLEREGAASEARRGLEERLSGLRQRAKLLSDLAEAHQKGRSALAECLAAVGIEEPRYLADTLAAVAGWEHSLDFYLGPLEDAVVVPEGEDALDLARALAGVQPLQGARPPAAILGPLVPAVEGGERAEIDDPAVVLAIGPALGLPPEMAAALPPGWLVRTSADAERLAHRHPGHAFLAPDGLWAQGGLLHLEGSRTVPGLLERERELAGLTVTIPEVELALAEAIEGLEALVAQRADRAAAAHRLEGEITQLKQEAAVAAARREDLVGRYERLSRQRGQIAEEREALSRQISAVDERRARLAADLSAAEARRGDLAAALELAEQALEMAKGERENLRTEHAGVEGRLALARERFTAQEREVARIERDREEGERQIRLWREESERLERRGAELVAEIEGAEAELAAFLTEKETSEEALLAGQARVDECRAEVRALEEQVAALRLQADAARQAVSELRIRQASTQQDAENLAEQFRDKLGSEPPAEVPPLLTDLATLEAALMRSREALERLGPVNALAAQEYAENEERYAFLTTQRADVETSIASLKATIREINATSSERFREVFAQVNVSFGEIFGRLFRGGEAEMRLQDEEDLLESGIEIVARPPGKRLQNIMLMSGGEKALTAIALLFALFRAKPSPFCILDEVDAPLDDANALRFVELVREMAGETQFIIITHNKITMRLAHVLYGVTMEERGISKVVGVAIDEVQPEAMARTA